MDTKKEEQELVFICKNCKSIQFAIQGSNIKCDNCKFLMSQMGVNRFTWENVLKEDKRMEYINRFLGENKNYMNDTQLSKGLDELNENVKDLTRYTHFIYDYTNDTQLLKILEELNKNVSNLKGYVQFFYVLGIISLVLSILGVFIFFSSIPRF